MLSRETKKWMSHALRVIAQRFLGIILIVGTLLAFAGPATIPNVYWAVVLLFNIFLATNAVRLASGMVITSVKTRKHVEVDWLEKYKRDLASRHEALNALEEVNERSPKMEDTSSDLTADWEGDSNSSSGASYRTVNSLKVPQPLDIHHIIVIPNYKEEMGTLCETLDTLAYHRLASNSYRIVLAMEEGEQECNSKAQTLITRYQSYFLSIQYTVHPKNIPGEARGKSSNVAWGVKYFAENWTNGESMVKELITVMDADTHLSEKYFECLIYKYCLASWEEKHRMLFAPTLIFDRNANEVPFVVRLADMAWSIGLISNFQLPVKFPCSVYTLSHLLAHRVNYWDAGPEAIGEDMHMALKCWTRLQMRLILSPIYIPASCSNVQADTYFGSVHARFEQSKRHLWGALDFGFAFAGIINHRCLLNNPIKSIMCIYLLFEIFFQPFFGFYQLPGQLIYPQTVVGFGAFVLEYTTYIRLALIPPALIVAFAYERYHFLACHYRNTVLKTNAQRKLALQKESDNLEAQDMIEVDENGQPIVTGQVAFRKWYQVTDWLGLPFGLIFYYMIPGVYAMIKQLFTNRMDYKVSLKPTTDGTKQEQKK